jgi:nucleoside 2-deoxyribosyltransferase
MVAFISGPYRAPTHRGIHQNIHKAAEVAAEVARLGYSVFCPHTNSHFVELLGNLGDDYWLAADLDIASKCDIMVLVDGWRASVGAVAEVEFARAHGIPVYELADLPEVHV